jgi:hypothetical protein
VVKKVDVALAENPEASNLINGRRRDLSCDIDSRILARHSVICIKLVTVTDEGGPLHDHLADQPVDEIESAFELQGGAHEGIQIKCAVFTNQ